VRGRRDGRASAVSWLIGARAPAQLRERDEALAEDPFLSRSSSDHALGDVLRLRDVLCVEGCLPDLSRMSMKPMSFPRE
jgi:hypothetical protein